MRNRILLAALLLPAAAATSVQASGPRGWLQASYADFVAGDADGVTIANDGSLSLGPDIGLRFDTGIPRIWAVAPDGDGSLFASVGEEGRVFRVDSDGARTIFFESDELGAQALEWGPDGALYVATGPKGGVYRLGSAYAGEAVEPWYRPDSTYVWDMAFDGAGRLLVAAGDPGRVLRLDSDGRAEVLYEGQSHVRVLLVSGDVIYAGTADAGLVIRIGVDGDAVVLRQFSEAEVTSLAAVDGTLMAGTYAGAAAAAPAAANGNGVPAASGATAGAVYRVDDDGFAEKLWSSATEGVHALAATTGGVVAGTGPNGLLLRLTPEGALSRLGRLDASQVVALVPAVGGGLLAATSNLAKLYSVPERHVGSGQFLSQVKDTGVASRWGVARWRAEVPQGTSVGLFTRSGNTATPDDSWSDWRGPYADPSESAITSPAARFIQWRADLATDDPSRSPALHRVEIAYVPRNLAPEIGEFQVHPAGVVYRQNAAFEDGLPFAQLPQAVAAELRELDQGGAGAAASARGFLGRPLYVPGLRTLAWEASDANGDPLAFDVQIRGELESEWKPLQRGLTETMYTFETGRVPDGVYLARLVATDAPGNAIGAEQRAEAISRPFVVDNTAPITSGTSARLDGRTAYVSASAADATSLIGGIDYSLDGGPWQVVVPRDGAADSSREQIELRLQDLATGEHTVVVRVSDTALNRAASKVVFVVR